MIDENEAALTCRDGTMLEVAGWLSLAAAPSFSIMAVLTEIFGHEATMGVMTPNPSLLSGMTPMYVLMAVFHSGPWLRLIGSARSRWSTREQESAATLGP